MKYNITTIDAEMSEINGHTTKDDFHQPSVRRNLSRHHSVTPFVIRQPIRRPHLLERVYKPMRTPH